MAVQRQRQGSQCEASEIIACSHWHHPRPVHGAFFMKMSPTCHERTIASTVPGLCMDVSGIKALFLVSIGKPVDSTDEMTCTLVSSCTLQVLRICGILLHAAGQ